MKTVSFKVLLTMAVLGLCLGTPLAGQDPNVPGSGFTGAAEPARWEPSVAEREAAIRGIGDRWTEAAAALGYSLDGWRDDLSGALQRLDNERLDKASKAGSYRELIELLGGKLLDPGSGSLEATVVGEIVPQALGDNSDDLSFTPINPCRIMDTRFGTGVYAGPLASGSTTAVNTSLTTYASQGGLTTACPGQIYDAGGLAYNITLTGFTGSGFVTVFPYTATRPNASTINFGPGAPPLANTAVVQQCYLCGPELNVYVEGASTHVIIDVVGYFNPAPASTCTGSRTADLALTGACQNVTSCTLANPSTRSRTVACEAVAQPQIAHTVGTHDEIAINIATASTTCGGYGEPGIGWIDVNQAIPTGSLHQMTTTALNTFTLAANTTQTYYENGQQVLPGTGGATLASGYMRCSLLP